MPTDYGDAQSMQHDTEAATPGTDLGESDLRYASHMIGQGENIWEQSHNTLFGVAVGAQGLFREFNEAVGIVDEAEDDVPLNYEDPQDVLSKDKLI